VEGCLRDQNVMGRERTDMKMKQVFKMKPQPKIRKSE